MFLVNTHHTHPHNPSNCILRYPVCFIHLLINGGDTDKVSMNTQTNSKHITQLLVSGDALSLSHSHPARVSAGLTCIDKAARVYHCTPASSEEKHMIRERDDDMFENRGQEDTDRDIWFIFVCFDFYVTTCVRGELYVVLILSGAGSQAVQWRS